MKSTEVLKSVGIDLGTSTTKLVFSELHIANTSSSMQVPKIEIVNRRVLHRSEIYRTPLLDEFHLNISKINQIIKKEFLSANIRKEDIQTGAVIITGESATKQNAKEVIDMLAMTSGDFLVATAGADLEGILAAKGAGAYAYSKKTSKTIANIDIGGGTANIAIISAGHLMATYTLHIGGRLIEYEKDTISFIAPSIKNLCSQNNWQLEEGDPADHPVIEAILNYMVELLWSSLFEEIDEQEPLLLGEMASWHLPVEEIMFSGGVSTCIYNGPQKIGKFHDIGNQLADKLKQSKDFRSIPRVKPQEMIGATVIGASTQTTLVSGSTIQVNRELLPYRNIPMMTIDFQNDYSLIGQKLQEIIKRNQQLFNIHEQELVAIYLKDLPKLSFKHIQLLAIQIIESLSNDMKQGKPIIIILNKDYGQSLGQSMISKSKYQHIICIDQIDVEMGDYIDIGEMLDANAVPVIVKTLAFPTS